MDSTVLYSAILAAGLVNMVIGALWYSPLLFGNIWMKAMKFTKNGAKADKYMGVRYAVAFLMGLMMITILAHYIEAFGATSAAMGAQAAFWLWLGFMVPVLAGDVLWSGKPISVFLINASHYLVALLVAGVILASWQA